MRSLALLLLIASAPVSVAQEGVSFYMLHMQDYVYLPETLEVPAGAQVVAMNFGPSDQNITGPARDEFYHTVTSSTDSALFDVQQIPPDGSPHPFLAPSVPGTYPYFCAYHGDAQGNGMVGTLVVVAATQSPSPSPSPSSSNDAPLSWGVIMLGVVIAGLLLRRR